MVIDFFLIEVSVILFAKLLIKSIGDTLGNTNKVLSPILSHQYQYCDINNPAWLHHFSSFYYFSAAPSILSSTLLTISYFDKASCTCCIHSIVAQKFLQSMTMGYDTDLCDMIWYNTIRYNTIWRYDTIWYDMIWYEMIWYDMNYIIWNDVWYTIWYNMIWLAVYFTLVIYLFKIIKFHPPYRNGRCN